MAYEDKDLEGALFSDNSAEIIGKGAIPINGQKNYCSVVKTKDRSGGDIYELMISAGRIYYNTPESKTSEKGPDLGGKVNIKGTDYKFAAWNNVSSGGTSYVKTKLTRSEETPF